jgi:hypothetical protein
LSPVDDVDIEAAFRYLSGTILRDAPEDWDIIFFGHTDFSDEARHGPDPSTHNFYIYKSVEPQGMMMTPSLHLLKMNLTMELLYYYGSVYI